MALHLFTFFLAQVRLASNLQNFTGEECCAGDLPASAGLLLLGHRTLAFLIFSGLPVKKLLTSFHLLLVFPAGHGPPIPQLGSAGFHVGKTFVVCGLDEPVWNQCTLLAFHIALGGCDLEVHIVPWTKHICGFGSF